MSEDALIRQRQMHELESQQQQLQQLQNALDRITQDHERLSYSVSHDLQEPLRMVVNFVSLLQKHYEHLFDERAREYIYYAVDGAQRMQKMVEHLLKYSRINTRGGEFQRVDLQACLNQALGLRQRDIEAIGAQIEIEALPEISADAKQIETLFANLLDNALLYRSNERQLHIKVGSKAKGAFWQVYMCDNGVGLDNKHFMNMFDVFKGFNHPTNQKGIGMGLSYCKQIVRRHGGDIWAENNKDQGLCINFTLLA